MRAVLDGTCDLIAVARDEGRRFLDEIEALEVARGLGIGVPSRLVAATVDDARTLDLTSLPGDRVVVKVVSDEVLHKSDAGGVVVVPKTAEDVASAVATMASRLAGPRIRGYSVNEFVAHDGSPGGEFLLGMRWTDDFGPVVTVALGGLHAELLAAHLRAGSEAAILPACLEGRSGTPILGDAVVGRLLTGRLRGGEPRIGVEAVEALLARCLEFARRHVPRDVLAFEVNPVVVTARGPIALDALLEIGTGHAPSVPSRPTWKLRHLLEPRSIAVVGVSERMNPGRLILANVLREGFDRGRVWVVKPGIGDVLGCRAVPSVSSLPEAVDLLVLAVDAGQVPGLVEESIAARRAETLIVIPGGLGEREGTAVGETRVRHALLDSRGTPWEGPLVNGGNCLGLRSRPGRYDTLFIPEHKIGASTGSPSPLAVLSQSGAFVAARANRLAGLNPRYLISFGNQIDVTVGDYLDYLESDPAVDVFACYVEGFRPLDGARWLRAAARIVASGRTVILYRAGRTAAGADAAASHTASIAGDYAVTRELCRRAGVILADSLADFDDLVKLSTLLRRKTLRGWRLSAVSNAGFECVVMADALGAFRLAPWDRETTDAIESLLRRRRLESIVSARNPLDLTPILDDEGFEEACRIVASDPATDVAVFGCVPMTGALNTLPRSSAHGEDVEAVDSVAQRLSRLVHELDKPAVVVVDGGYDYDRMAALLEEHGVPTFRSADRALRLLQVVCGSRFRLEALDIRAADTERG